MASIECAARWYLVHTKAACEATAEANLVRQGYAVYWPRLLKPLRAKRQWVERVVSLFPRYLFLRLELAQQALAPVRSTLGVAAVVRFGCDYTVVPEGVVEALRTRADPATGLHRLSSLLEPGASVRILAGAFDGLEGVFDRECGDERVVVLLSLLGRDTPVRIPAAFVARRFESAGAKMSSLRDKHAQR